ncbi:MAG TPA: efflux RND transporter permease subunit [Dyella sp.]|uniref:efflux RND transporter permease subunit n=1 Tax=Dyella sp. TaxID=1869338 RepID=UPI002D785F3A|nr:efflux RND transporter permease subunit [Dyella sp.]HET6552427.1 efflux RND transporter permease subunit [Dyella sp.]
MGLLEFADIEETNGASFIYRENNSRYIGVQFSVEGRDLAGAVEDAIQQVNGKVKLPQGYRLDWGGADFPLRLPCVGRPDPG